MSAQEGDSGESYRAGVYWGSSDGLQQGLQDACHGHNWTLHHGGALRWAPSFLEELTYHTESLAPFFSEKKNLIVCIFVPFSVNANKEDLQIMLIKTKL